MKIDADLENKILAMTDKELLDLVHNKKDYREEVLAFAEKEITQRGGLLQLEKSVKSMPIASLQSNAVNTGQRTDASTLKKKVFLALAVLAIGGYGVFKFIEYSNAAKEDLRAMVEVSREREERLREKYDSATTRNQSSLKVKGLYIGMDIKEVPGILKQKFPPNTMGVHDVAKGDAGNFPDNIQGCESEDFYVAIGGMLPLGAVIASPDGKVKSIRLSGMVVDALFNSADMDASDYVQQFIDSYDIPEMKVADDMESWVYTSRDGIKVKIDTKKSLFIEKVASTQERKKSFD
ncbi:MAG TPA: hypothetical protein P5567_09635 [Kiritimatiellia bacterium]|nr:hypothetical protein [Candidatus Brocadiia bacterium]HRZ12701.1 hypothetical protein [Kiritimatiellia bacterium]HSA18347.1 hypothetical protein [Kiritimatiellia bacterium]